MDFDEKYCFGNVMSCRFYDKILNPNFLALKWKFAEN
jgi:hypothetical protein